MLSNVWKKKEINEWGVLFQTTAYVYWNENHCLESSLISVRVAYCFLFARNRLNIPAIPLQLLSLFTERHFIWHLTQFSDLWDSLWSIYIFFFYLLMQQNNIFYAQLHVCYEYPRWVMVRGHKRLQNTREKGREGQLKLKTVFKLFMRYKQAQSDWVYSFFIFIFLAQCRRPSCHYFCSVAPAFTYSDINQR